MTPQYLVVIKKLLYSFLVLLLIAQVDVYGQKQSQKNASLIGYVKDSKTEETLIGATVFLTGTNKGAYTNKNGFFSVRNIKPGTYDVRITSVGYTKKVVKIVLKPGQSLRKSFLIEPQEIQTETVVVQAEREIEKRQITVSKVNIPIRQIKQIRIGGESDVFRSLQMLPGILTSSQISSGLYVRGGSPDQNLVLLDGATVYNPTHLFGFLSTFNSEAIKDVELIKGAYPAEYGSRLSSVLNITQKDGNRKNYQGGASLGIISSKVNAEGPVGNGSWFLGARRTYFDLLKKAIPESEDSPLPDFGFYDMNGKLVQNITENDKITFSGFLSNDHLKYGDKGFDFTLDVGNRLGAVKWTHIYSDNFFSNFLVSGSHYFNNILMDLSGYELKIDNAITDYTAKLDFEWLTTETLTAKFGGKITNYNSMFYQDNSGQGSTSSSSGEDTPSITDIKLKEWTFDAFAQINYQYSDQLSLQAGLRASYWKLSKETMLDPRMAVRYQMYDEFAIKASWGVFHQNLRLAANPNISIFDTWFPADGSMPISKSDHYIISFETEPEDGYNLNFDVYYKTLDNISAMRGIIQEVRNVNDMFYNGDGDAYGGELFLQRKFGRLTGWVGYGLGWVNVTFEDLNVDGGTFHPKYDRRHDLKLVGQYKINDSWEIGATFTLQSGQPYTPIISVYRAPMDGENRGTTKSIEGPRNSERLPMSHQLNVNANHNFKMFGLDAVLIIDIFNLYNRRDIWFRTIDKSEALLKYKDVKLLPIIPTVSIELKI